MMLVVVVVVTVATGPGCRCVRDSTSSGVRAMSKAVIMFDCMRLCVCVCVCVCVCAYMYVWMWVYVGAREWSACTRRTDK
jgi:hypothetical protein